MSQFAELRALLEKRKYGVTEVATEPGPSLLLNQDDPEGGVAAGDQNDPAALIEIWPSGDLLCLDTAEIGTVKFESAGRATGDGRQVNAVLIRKNAPLPAAVTRRFRTARAGQRSLEVRVVEGEAERPEDCTPVGRLVMTDLPAGLPAGAGVEVTYRYGADGRLRVSARVVGHAAHAATEFVRDGGLSDDDLLLWGERLRAPTGPGQL